MHAETLATAFNRPNPRRKKSFIRGRRDKVLRPAKIQPGQSPASVYVDVDIEYGPGDIRCQTVARSALIWR